MSRSASATRACDATVHKKCFSPMTDCREVEPARRLPCDAEMRGVPVRNTHSEGRVQRVVLGRMAAGRARRRQETGSERFLSPAPKHSTLHQFDYLDAIGRKRQLDAGSVRLLLLRSTIVVQNGTSCVSSTTDELSSPVLRKSRRLLSLLSNSSNVTISTSFEFRRNSSKDLRLDSSSGIRPMMRQQCTEYDSRSGRLLLCLRCTNSLSSRCFWLSAWLIAPESSVDGEKTSWRYVDSFRSLALGVLISMIAVLFVMLFLTRKSVKLSPLPESVRPPTVARS